MGSFSRGLCWGVWVLECQGISVCRVKGMCFRWRTMRFMRAKGEGVAEIRVSGSEAVEVEDMVGC